MWCQALQLATTTKNAGLDLRTPSHYPSYECRSRIKTSRCRYLVTFDQLNGWSLGLHYTQVMFNHILCAIRLHSFSRWELVNATRTYYVGNRKRVVDLSAQQRECIRRDCGWHQIKEVY